MYLRKYENLKEGQYELILTSFELKLSRRRGWITIFDVSTEMAVTLPEQKNFTVDVIILAEDDSQFENVEIYIEGNTQKQVVVLYLTPEDEYYDITKQSLSQANRK